MADILPKNPHLEIDLHFDENEQVLLRLGWQQGQDRTMEALRPILEDAFDCLRVLRVGTQTRITMHKTNEVIDKLEQILKEMDDAK